MIECEHRTEIDEQWGRCALMPIVHPECPPARVHLTACQHCQSGNQNFVMDNLAERWTEVGYYYGDPKPEKPGLAQLCPPPVNRVPVSNPRWVSVVLTAPRPRANYLENTCASIERAGFPRPLIFAEPGTEIPEDRRKDTTQWARLMGPYQNSLAAMTAVRLGMGSRDFDFALVCEDDIEVTPGTRDYLDNYALCPGNPAELGCISLYTTSKMAEGPVGWHPWPRILPSAAALVLSKPGLEKWIWHPGHTNHKQRKENKPALEAYMDMEISKWCMATKRPVYLCRGKDGASLVSHVGDVSSMFPFKAQGTRKEKVWLGAIASQLHAGPTKKCGCG